MCKVLYHFFHTHFITFRAKFVLGRLHKDRAKSNGCARTLQKTGSGFLKEKLLLFGFWQRPLSKGTGNHPSAKQQIMSVALNHTRGAWQLKRTHLGKQGGTAPSSGRKVLFLFLLFLVAKRSAFPLGHGTRSIALALIAVHMHLLLVRLTWLSHFTKQIPGFSGGCGTLGDAAVSSNPP